MKTLFTSLFLFFLTTSAWAQVELAFSYGYRFGGRTSVRVDNVWGDLRVQDSDAFTGDARFNLSSGTQITLSYTRQVTSIDFVRQGLFDTERLFNTTVEYITLGGCRGGSNQIGLNPFGCLGLGMGILTPRNVDLNTTTRMAANLSGGFNYFFTEKVGLRVSVGILTPFQFASGGLFCGGGGCGVGVGASSTILQGDLSAGVVVRLGGSDTPPASRQGSW